MGKKLDKARDFGTIIGDDQGRVYEQDGKFFTGSGEEWTEQKKPAVKTVAVKLVDDQLAAQLGADA